MRGLILRDLLSYWRRSLKSAVITDICLFVFFMLLGMRSQATAQLDAYGYLLLCMPLGTGSVVPPIKDNDMVSNGGAALRYLPFLDRQIVLARFLAVGCVGLYHTVLMSVFCVVHGLLYGVFDAGTYILLLIFGWMTGLVLSSINLVTAYLGSNNAVAVVYLLVIALSIGAYLGLLFMDIDIYAILSSQLLLWGAAVFVTAMVVVLCFVISVKAYGRRR